MLNNLFPLDYKHLRNNIHLVFYDLLKREIECAKDNEFDNEYMEACTDDILRLIKRQGGTY